MSHNMMLQFSNNCFGSIGYYSIGGWKIVNDELERMWKEVVMDYFKVLFHNFPGGMRNTIKNLSE
jgi:hypothetical protein